MSKRVVWLSYSLVSLAIGAVLYGLFRCDTYIGRVVGSLIPLKLSTGSAFSNFAAYYLPDYLWMFSMVCALFAVRLPQRGEMIALCCVGFVTGVIWELLQLCSIVSGTADIHDVIMYSFAVASAAMINILKRGQMMKKVVSFLMILAIIGSFSLFALASSAEPETADQGNGQVGSTEADNSSLGDYSVEIKSCRLAESFDNKPVVIVTYGFTNVKSDEAVAFYIAFEDAVYQGGVGLNEAYILADSANYSADNQTKEIKKGASLDVEVAYELNDTTTDIEVEVQELFSFDDKKLTKTFKIA